MRNVSGRPSLIGLNGWHTSIPASAPKIYERVNLNRPRQSPSFFWRPTARMSLAFALGRPANALAALGAVGPQLVCAALEEAVMDTHPEEGVLDV